MFTVNYCGYNVHNPNHDTIYRPVGRGDYLFLMLNCRMDFFFPEDSAHAGGEYVMRDGNRLTRVQAQEGSCILYTPGMMHYYTAPGAFINSYVHFSCDEGDLHFLGDIPAGELFRPSGTVRIADCLKDIQYEYLSSLPLKNEKLDLLTRNLLLEIRRNMTKSPASEEPGENFALLNRNRIYMLQHCSQDWSIDRLCKATHLGRSQFYHYYRLYFNSSPREELLAARIDKAMHLLTNQELHVSEAAEQSGFNNINHFNRYFRRATGCSPTEYQKRLKSEQ
jgi:AraC-like DNA-binding protein